VIDVPGIDFRDAEPRDEGFLRALYRGSREAELASTGWSEAAKQAFADSQFTLQDRHYREHYRPASFLVIERAGTPIGRLYLQRDDKELRVIDVLLAAQSRNAGIGTAIMTSLQAEAARRGIAVTLHVEARNPARALYARLGFREEAGEGLYVRMRWDAPA
jgi:ribosomal protein S18 acetylase RimI-like enzyme